MLTSDLLNKVYLYLDKELSLEELEEWLVPRLSHLFSQAPPSTAADLAATIELGLAELNNGSQSEDEFRSLLKGFLKAQEAIWLQYADPEPMQSNYTQSSNEQLSPPDIIRDLEPARA